MGWIKIFLLCVVSFSAFANDADEKIHQYAKKLFQRVTGVPPAPQSSTLTRMEMLIAQGKRLEAAEVAMNDSEKNFYSIRLRNFAAPMTNVEESPSEPFNDLQALVLGIARDDLDARLLLTGDLRYQGYPSLGLPPPSRKDNAHYAEFETSGANYWRDLMRSPQGQWEDIDVAAGALTTRAWAKAFYSAGTNRRGFQYTMQIFLCATKEQWKSAGSFIPDHFVRRDVNRNIGGDPSQYQNDCRRCHGIMDAMGGAFAHLDYVDNAIIYTPNEIPAKMNNTPEGWFPEGYVTRDDTWVNYALYDQNAAFGWRGPLTGRGIKKFGEMIANSKGFSQCMVKRTFKEVCNRPAEVSEMNEIISLADKFETSGYKLKKLFAMVATHNNCMAAPQGVGGRK